MTEPRRAPPEVSCAGKEAMTAERAQTVARQIRRRKGGRPNAYRCVHCSSWHVGHGSKKPDPRKEHHEHDPA